MCENRVQDILLEILFLSKEISSQRKLQASSATFDGHVAEHGGPILVIEFKCDYVPAEPQMAGDFLRLALQARKDITLAWCQPCLGIIIRGLIIYLSLNSLLKIYNRSIISCFGHARLANSHYKYISMQRQRVTRSRSILCRIHGSSDPHGRHKPRCGALCQFSTATNSAGEETLSKRRETVPVS